MKKYNPIKAEEKIMSEALTKDEKQFLDSFTLDNEVTKYEIGKKSRMVGGRKMRKEDLKAGYVLVFGDGRKQFIAPISYKGEETLAMFTRANDTGCQEIKDYDPFKADNIIEVWGMASRPAEALTTNLEHRKLLWKKESPVKVTGDEKAFLSNLPDVYTYIARDDYGRLFVYNRKPELWEDGFYRGSLYTEMKYLTKLTFDAIKPLACYKISDLL